MTPKESRLEQAKIDVAAEEAERRREDRVISLTPAPNGIIALTASGRLFSRELDARANMNLPLARQTLYRWTELEGPLG